MGKVNLYGSELDKNTFIWRYIDISKYLSMLINSSLYFTRIDALDDIYEGKKPVKQLKFMIDQLKLNDDRAAWFLMHDKEFSDYMKRHSGVNCWHINASESIAMWKIYLKTGEGLAIKSTINRLMQSFDKLENNQNIYIREVNYGDYESLQFGDFLYGEYFHKREFFSYEKELRAIIITSPPEEELKKHGGNDLSIHKGLNGGISMKVNLNILIEEIVLAPYTPLWISQLIIDVTNKYNFNFPVLRSKMEK